MTRAPHWLLPQRISSQIVLITVVSLLVVQTILSASFLIERHEPNNRHTVLPQLATLLLAIDAAEPQSRSSLVPAIDRVFPDFEITLVPDGFGQSNDTGREARRDRLAQELGPGFSVMGLEAGTPADGTAMGRAAVRLRDGHVVTARLPVDDKPGPFPVTPVALTLTIITTLLGLWATRALTAPLRAFAAAAEAFNPDAAIAPLPETGPAEIRTATRALNRMCERIKRLVSDRVRMLAAVGHDLRTPITRLRLCSEFVDDAELRRQMLDTLDQMATMVDSVLNFLRDGRAGERATMIDLAISLRTICDQFADIGHDVSYDGPDHLIIQARPGGLRRAVTNLIDNAIRYGIRALVRLRAGTISVVISVEDEGPGIPDHSKEAMLEPFVRGDAARGMDGPSGFGLAGFGLGLSIARQVAVDHGGTLAMLDRQPTGLIATIELPLSWPAGRGACDPAPRQSTGRHS